tara:strand:- start:71047 stop:71256 length:210 start_codon:yes stop_codon:yes gene_type:complete
MFFKTVRIFFSSSILLVFIPNLVLAENISYKYNLSTPILPETILEKLRTLNHELGKLDKTLNQKLNEHS